MDQKQYVVAVDQGTTSSKAIVLNRSGDIVGRSKNFEVPHQFPAPGFVEFNPEQMLTSVRNAIEDSLSNARVSPSQIKCMGLANQGETVIAFDRLSGEPIAPAISWQDRRSHLISKKWESNNKEITQTTGLKSDSYFSAPKMAWILQEIPTAKKLGSRLALGTSDAWLISQLTREKNFVTDIATASRTMLLNLKSGQWEESLLKFFEIPFESLPKILSNNELTGTIDIDGEMIPLTGICVDQHAALFGHGCLRRGEAKVTYGTGCFMLANIGEDPNLRIDGLLTALGWRLKGQKSNFVFEGTVFSAASILNWLKDINILNELKEIDELENSVRADESPYLIPAFVGLASPHWNNSLRASWHGLNLSTTRSQLIRSAIEAIAFQVKEIFQTIEKSGFKTSRLNVDGGLSQSRFLMKLQADILGCDLFAAPDVDVTSLGVGYMAGLGSGLWSSVEDLPFKTNTYSRFSPSPNSEALKTFLEWQKICQRELRV